MKATNIHVNTLETNASGLNIIRQFNIITFTRLLLCLMIRPYFTFLFRIYFSFSLLSVAFRGNDVRAVLRLTQVGVSLHPIKKKEEDRMKKFPML